MSVYDEKKKQLEERLKGIEAGIGHWSGELAKNNAFGRARFQANLESHQADAANVRKELESLSAVGDPLKKEVKETMEVAAPKREAMTARKPFLSPEILAMRQKFFDQQKGQAKQQGIAQKQQGEEAIARRFASLGASGSGAQVAAMQKNVEAAADTERKGLEDVAGQELQVKEGDVAREFQSDMAERGMEFQGSMADRETAFRQQLANVDQANKLKGMDMAERQFEIDKMTTEFNKQMAMADLEAAKQSAQAKRRSGQLAMLGTIGGGIAGAYLGGPAGASAGATMGSSLGGTLICTELNLQGFISDDLLKLDAKFGMDFREENINLYIAYLIFAEPVVRFMKKSKLFSYLIAFVFIPWCSWMGHKYDKTIKNSFRGYVVAMLMKHIVLPLIFKFKTCKVAI